MGLLDDAIREHLELKRRSGADARELARLEHAAFGPVRGGDGWADEDEAPQEEPSATSEAPFDDEPQVAEPAAYEPPPAASVTEDALPEPFVSEPEPYEEPSYEDDEPSAAYEPPPLKPSEDPQATVAFTLADEVAAETPPLPEDRIDPPEPASEDYLPPSPPAPARPRDGADPDVVPADEEAHDELEETPEFLEETPEHDRLWFEQKPPRDFDF